MNTEDEELFLECINAIADQDDDLLNQLIHPEAVFERYKIKKFKK